MAIFRLILKFKKINLKSLSPKKSKNLFFFNIRCAMQQQKIQDDPFDYIS